ncbi:hypothetical protein ACFYTQ_33405 [Nocardia sp. NPDC004068]|uniref:hypothetical protein n=1 Tax=Nocardia sp. NPDC004068 TaxID=3364303 RepID=UPI0036A38DBD
MTESPPLQIPDPDKQLKAAVAQELKRCWLTKVGSKSDVRGIVVDGSGTLNSELLKSLTNLQALISQCLQDTSLDLREPEVLYIPLLEAHPAEPELEYSRAGRKRTVEELGQEEKAWAIGVMMRLLKDYPDKSYGNDDDNDWTSGRQRYATHILWINRRQLYDSEDPKNSSRSLRDFLTAYVEHLVEKLTDEETCSRVIEAARAKMQELAARRPAVGDDPATPLQPDAVGPEPDDNPAEDDLHAPAPDTDATEEAPPATSDAGSSLKRRWKHLVATGAVLTLVIGGIVIFVHRGSGSGHTSTMAGLTSSSTAPAPPGVSLSPSNTCDDSLPAAAVAEPDVDICVVYWCLGIFHAANGVDSIPGRGQIKMRPLIFNRSSHTVDISITPNAALRLLVSTPGNPRDWWQPPPATAKNGDHPNIVTWKGEVMWAVPPNAHRDAMRIDMPDGLHYTYDGFATFWEYTTLDAGQTAFKPLRFNADGNPIQEGDLVFNVPLDENSRIRGLVLVDRNDPSKILAVSDAGTWPPRSDLNSF